jgi:hypothetical protein
VSPILRRAPIIALGIIAALHFAPPAWAVWPPSLGSSKPADKVATIFAALGKSDYEAFVAGGDPAFSALPRGQFESAAARIGPRLRGSYCVLPLGELKKDGELLTLWKIKFRDGGDDLLVTLRTKDDRITGLSVN